MSSVSPSSSTHCFVSIIIVLSDQIQDKREGWRGGGGFRWLEWIEQVMDWIITICILMLTVKSTES